MSSNHKYRFNQILLFFKDKNTEKAFNINFFKQDLYALRLVIILGVSLSIIFLIVDVFRYENNLVSIIFRGGMALLLLLIGGLTFLFQEEKYKLTQYIGCFIVLLISFVFFLQYHFNTDPAFDIFLSNIMMVLIFIGSTIMGMRFRYSMAVNTINFASYILYIHYINYSDIADRQISQLFVIYTVGLLAAYVLDKQKINAFIHKDELDIEVEKVDELNKVKDKLFSIISHDLRGPIVSLKGILSLLNKGAISQEEFNHLSRNLENDLNSSSNLLDNLLAWSKSQLDGIELNKTNLNLLLEVTALENLFQTQLKAKAISLEVSINQDLNILADRETIQIAIRNILSNAIKFTPHGGKIVVDANKINGDIEIKISDSGVGIAKEKLKDLFKLNKMTLIGSSSASGAGIGLLLVKEFIELNDGSVNVESSLGHGTTFFIRFPQY